MSGWILREENKEVLCWKLWFTFGLAVLFLIVVLWSVLASVNWLATEHTANARIAACAKAVPTDIRRCLEGK